MASTSVLDWLTAPDQEQSILRYLTKCPQSKVADIAAITQIPTDELEVVLSNMVGDAHLVEQLKDGQRTFSVRFNSRNQLVRNMPAAIYQIFEQPPDTFLAEVPLTSILPPEVREQLLSRSITRKVLANEVLVWQGEKSNHVGLVRHGLLKKTRLKGRQAGQESGYINRSEWFGIGQALSSHENLETFTAVVDSEVLLWPAEAFFAIARSNAPFCLAISRYLSQKLHILQSRQAQGAGIVWALKGARPQSGVTTIALNLALLASRNGNGTKPRVLLWLTPGQENGLLASLDIAPDRTTRTIPKQQNFLKDKYGDIDILLRAEPGDYSPRVRLNIILNELQSQYDYIICDTGSIDDDELVLRLCGQAHTLITITDAQDGAAAATHYWQQTQPYATPGQKRVLALNRATANIEIDPAFQLVIPEDNTDADIAHQNGHPIVLSHAESQLGKALTELYRRLSLNNALAIFVPSTIEVDEATDNSLQVQATLSFLGNLFGGATSSDADGVWRSEESGLVAEKVTIVRTFVAKKALESHLDDVIGFATDLKQEMKQEAIALDIDNQLILV